MSLLDATTQVPAGEMREILSELRNDLKEMRATLEHPPADVTDPYRLQTARDLLSDTWLRISPLDVDHLPKDELRLWVNLVYTVNRVAVEYLKGCTSMPQVPRPRPVSP